MACARTPRQGLHPRPTISQSTDGIRKGDRTCSANCQSPLHVGSHLSQAGTRGKSQRRICPLQRTQQQPFPVLASPALGMVPDLGGYPLSKKMFTAFCLSPAATPLLAPLFLRANSLPVC